MMTLPSVVIRTSPFVGAVHDHQTELPPTLPAWFGSPPSFVAATLDPMTVTFVPVITIRFENRSFAGAAPHAGRAAIAHSAQLISPNLFILEPSI